MLAEVTGDVSQSLEDYKSLDQLFSKNLGPLCDVGLKKYKKKTHSGKKIVV